MSGHYLSLDFGNSDQRQFRASAKCGGLFVGLCRKCDGLSSRARRPACRDHTLRHICVIASGADIGEHPITPFGPVGIDDGVLGHRRGQTTV
jgi:hypothetical protein